MVAIHSNDVMTVRGAKVFAVAVFVEAGDVEVFVIRAVVSVPMVVVPMRRAIRVASLTVLRFWRGVRLRSRWGNLSLVSAGRILRGLVLGGVLRKYGKSLKENQSNQEKQTWFHAFLLERFNLHTLGLASWCDVPTEKPSTKRTQLIVRWRTAAICRISSARIANSSGKMDCMPSDRALSGS
jgi:hypothetical protein